MTGFAGALVLVDVALLAGWLFYEPSSTEPGAVAALVAEPGRGWGWCPVAFTAGMIGLGIYAVVVGRLRTTKEVVMHTLETRRQEVTATQVHTLQRRSRWLAIALAFVLVVGAVAIGWLIAENRSLSSDLDTAIWPPESELTARQQYMLDVVGPEGEFYETWNAGDFDAFYALHTATAFNVVRGRTFSFADEEGRNRLEGTQRGGYDDLAVTRVWIMGERNAAAIVDSAALGPALFVYTFAADTADPPITSFSLFAVEEGSTLLSP